MNLISILNVNTIRLTHKIVTKNRLLNKLQYFNNYYKMIAESAFFAILYFMLFAMLKDVLPIPMKRTQNGYEAMDKLTSTKIVGTYLVLQHELLQIVNLLK